MLQSVLLATELYQLCFFVWVCTPKLSDNSRLLALNKIVDLVIWKKFID
jgi:hypothetical protein